MCLIIYHPYQPKFFVRLKARTARRDIICYKRLYKTKEGLTTPYRHLKVDTSLPLIADFLGFAKEMQDFYMVTHGIHTYVDLYPPYISGNYILYKCTCGHSYKKTKVIVDLPKVSIKKPAGSKAGFTVKWKKLSKKNRNKVSGVEIQYSTRNDFASSYKIVTAKKTAASKKISKLPRKTTYYVRVRTYKWISGKKHVSKWSAVKKVRTK